MRAWIGLFANRLGGMVRLLADGVVRQNGERAIGKDSLQFAIAGSSAWIRLDPAKDHHCCLSCGSIAEDLPPLAGVGPAGWRVRLQRPFKEFQHL